MRGDVAQGGIDLKMLVGVGVGDPELLFVAHFQGYSGRVQRLGHVADVLQTAGKIIGIVLRDDSIFKRLKRIQGDVLRGGAGDDRFRCGDGGLKREPGDNGDIGFDRLRSPFVCDHTEGGGDHQAGATDCNGNDDPDKDGFVVIFLGCLNFHLCSVGDNLVYHTLFV